MHVCPTILREISIHQNKRGNWNNKGNKQTKTPTKTLKMWNRFTLFHTCSIEFREHFHLNYSACLRIELLFTLVDKFRSNSSGKFQFQNEITTNRVLTWLIFIIQRWSVNFKRRKNTRTSVWHVLISLSCLCELYNYEENKWQPNFDSNELSEWKWCI